MSTDESIGGSQDNASFPVTENTIRLIHSIRRTLQKFKTRQEKCFVGGDKDKVK